jgi:hypothetical protein
LLLSQLLLSQHCYRNTGLFPVSESTGCPLSGAAPLAEAGLSHTAIQSLSFETRKDAVEIVFKPKRAEKWQVESLLAYLFNHAEKLASSFYSFAVLFFAVILSFCLNAIVKQRLLLSF